jgi:DNA-binding response OmpR family regulator
VPGQKVLIAHHSEEVSKQIGPVLIESGFRPIHAKNGNHAVHILEKHKPEAIIIDVALEKILSFQLIDQIRNDPRFQGIKIILVASVFNKSAYKSKPTSLYGADDYVEHHHILDLLPLKIRELLGVKTIPNINTRPMPSLQEPPEPAPSNDINTLAHSIASDIALYHQKEIEKMIADGNLERIEPVLEEGRQLLQTKLGHSNFEGDPILDAFKKLLSKLRK